MECSTCTAACLSGTVVLQAGTLVKQMTIMTRDCPPRIRVREKASPQSTHVWRAATENRWPQWTDPRRPLTSTLCRQVRRENYTLRRAAAFCGHVLTQRRIGDIIAIGLRQQVLHQLKPAPCTTSRQLAADNDDDNDGFCPHVGRPKQDRSRSRWLIDFFNRASTGSLPFFSRFVIIIRKDVTAARRQMG